MFSSKLSRGPKSKWSNKNYSIVENFTHKLLLTQKAVITSKIYNDIL